ncbi:hypothetical protein [Actinomadura sp. NPDC049753]|uniref:hypothetical protein n=1 Tax=Actinomadura sp. NPDC049753 TaxID=3154739 RepID=UPI0034245AC7
MVETVEQQDHRRSDEDEAGGVERVAGVGDEAEDGVGDERSGRSGQPVAGRPPVRRASGGGLVCALRLQTERRSRTTPRS